jgi:bacterioferritin
MQGDPKVIEYLNRPASRAYVDQSILAALSAARQLGPARSGKVWHKESIEAMEHADRINFLDGFSNMQVLDPLRIGRNVQEVIDCDRATEMTARPLYQEAATCCHQMEVYVTRDLFELLMMDEEHHIDFLETELDLINRIGLELLHPEAYRRAREGRRALTL